MPRFHLSNLSPALLLAALLAAGPPAAASDGRGGMDAFVASLEGAWVAEQVETPRGAMPFALLFERLPDGSLHAHTPRDRETFVDVTFRRSSDGRWLLVEHARLPEAGDQQRILVPAGSAGGTRRFADAIDPDLVAIDLAVTEDSMEITAWVRGTRHVHGTLHRLPAEAVPGLRERLRAMEARPHRPPAGEGSR